MHFASREPLQSCPRFITRDRSYCKCSEHDQSMGTPPSTIFKSLLEDLNAKYGDVIYHNNVRWLSLGKVIKRVWLLQDEILLFLDIKNISHDFVTKVKCEEWRYEMMFAADIFEKLNKFNVTLQGKGLLAHECGII